LETPNEQFLKIDILFTVFSYWLTFGELCPQTPSSGLPLSGPGYASKRTVGHSSSAAFTLSDGNHYHILRCLYA